MAECSLQRAAGIMDWIRIRCLYQKAFPTSERKPFAVIRRMHRQGLTDVWVLRQSGRFAGFASTINGKGIILIDYLAVAGKMRSRGLGSAALQALCGKYPDCGMFVEIESPFEPGEDQTERQRRRVFYERGGFQPSRTMADVFGVPMELLCCGCTVDFEQYHSFYCTYYSEWAGAHIKPLPYPEA